MTTNLANCIASVDFACRTLEAGNATLAEETKDLSRLAKVLRSKRHFDLIAEQEIKDASDHLSAEILPQLKELILRAEEALQKDERKAKMLRGKSVQQSTKLDQLAQLYDLSIEEMRQISNKSDHGKGEETEKDAKQTQQTNLEMNRLREKLNNLRQKRKIMQNEMIKLEKDVKQM